MFERGDRALGRERWQLTVVIAVILAAVLAGAFLWYRGYHVSESEQAKQGQPEEASALSLPDAALPLTVFAPVNGLLHPAASAIRRQPELQLEMREAAEAVLSDERSAAAVVLKDLAVRALYLDAAGTVYVDLSPGDRGSLRASARDELLAVYALVNTLMENFSEVRQVRLLVGGREALTLAGHIDLSRAFIKRADLIRSEGAGGDH